MKRQSTSQRKPPVIHPVAAALKARVDMATSLLPHMVELGEAGKTFGVDMSALVSDASPERAANLRRSFNRMDRALTAIEQLVQPPTSGAVN
jgi:hypothetical protein